MQTTSGLWTAGRKTQDGRRFGRKGDLARQGASSAAEDLPRGHSVPVWEQSGQKEIGPGKVGFGV